MKRFLAAFVFAFGVAAFAPAVHADCGSCGKEAKPHAHAAGEKHEGCECATCDKAKEDCECKKSADAACDCGKAEGECACDKKE